MNSRKKQLAAAAVAVAAVCLSIIFVWMFGSLVQQAITPEQTLFPATTPVESGREEESGVSTQS